MFGTDNVAWNYRAKRLATANEIGQKFDRELLISQNHLSFSKIGYFPCRFPVPRMAQTNALSPENRSPHPIAWLRSQPP
jgi:hypothetical protein